jgi:hypothetical protein
VSRPVDNSQPALTARASGLKSAPRSTIRSSRTKPREVDDKTEKPAELGRTRAGANYQLAKLGTADRKPGKQQGQTPCSPIPELPLLLLTSGSESFAKFFPPPRKNVENRPVI